MFSDHRQTNSIGCYKLAKWTAPLCVVVAANLSPTGAAAGESRGFVVDWFHVATAYVESNCPDGLNPLSDEFYKRELRRLGYENQEVEDLMKDFPNGGYIPVTTMRGRVNGEPVNVYANPWTQPDPNLKPVAGNRGFGFNLDGKNSGDDFIDPVSNESGVDNQMYRAMGCIQNFAFHAPDLPIYPYAQWDLTRDTAPAWLIEIRDIDDFQNDDDITIILDKSVDAISRDTNGDALADMTLRVDPNSRSRTIVHGSIKNGVVISEAFDTKFEADPMLLPLFEFTGARMRLSLDEGGAAQGILGGYQPWEALYWSYAQGAWIVEHSAGIDIPGVYYALKKHADAEPDPETGENKAISTAWWVDAQPAIIVYPQEAQTANATP
jgi:hypothetical protein